VHPLSALLTLLTAPTGALPAPGDLTLAAAVEFRPNPRPGATLEHRVGPSVRLEHALSAGLGGFPDLEWRTSLRAAWLGPAMPWAALRSRRIHLTGLPPVENYLGLGIGLSSDPGRRISLAGGLGVRFQLPPLIPEAAGDRSAYFAENVQPELFFALRVRCL
jgi:hypothetical protein